MTFKFELKRKNIITLNLNVSYIVIDIKLVFTSLIKILFFFLQQIITIREIYVKLIHLISLNFAKKLSGHLL